MASQARKQARCEPTYNPDVGGTQSVGSTQGWLAFHFTQGLSQVCKESLRVFTAIGLCFDDQKHAFSWRDPGIFWHACP